MKRIIPCFVLSLLIWGCSSTDPSVLDQTVSDSNPVTRQRVLLQVWAMSDNYPLRYSWEADGGNLGEWNEDQYHVYWITPETPGTFTITCTVTDDEDNSTAYSFEIPVSERRLETLLEDGMAACLEKQRVSLLGGTWVSTRETEEGRVRFLSSSANEATVWTGVFGTMHVDMYYPENSYSMSSALWGAPAVGNRITIKSSSSAVITVTSDEWDSAGTIHDLEVDAHAGSYPNFLWIAAGDRLYWYDSSEGAPPEVYEEAIRGPRALFPGEDFVYVASSSGIYILDGFEDDIPLHTGDSCAGLEVVGDDGTAAVWHVTGGAVCRDGMPLPSQPDSVVCSLDKDLDSYIWCGKYRWNGSSWEDPAGLGDVEVVKSVASNEGLVYFLTASGALLRW
ncbi:MAG: hypothetical protein WAR22_04540 [Desulfomonilia bacterium]